MGAIIPEAFSETETSRYLASLDMGIELIHKGKVRNSYASSADPDHLLVEATDRISIFDIVLPALIPQKGAVLTAMTHFWLTKILHDFPHHLAFSETNPLLNAVHDLKIELPELPLERCLVVKRMKIPPYELIFRKHLGGHGWDEYQETECVAGHRLPPNLSKWSYFEEPLFTPSTKEEVGNDVYISAQEYLQAMGERGKNAVDMFSRAYKRAYDYAKSKRVIILDTKFEGCEAICDEVLTPDSSRFTFVRVLDSAMRDGRDPIFYDKQLVREWGNGVVTPWGEGLSKLDPLNPEHIEFVHSLEVPEDIISFTSMRYLLIFNMLTAQSLDNYQRDEMFIDPR